MTTRSIAVVTVGRSDFGILRPVLRRLLEEPSFRLQLIVGGMHLAPEFGETIREIEQEGFPIAEKVEMLDSDDSPEGMAQAMGRGLAGFSRAFARLRPDLVFVTGDRFEMFSAAAAAVPFNLPIAHLHGGEISEGAVDDLFRHAITQMSHLHFVSTETYRNRLLQMGQEDWRVAVSGAPGLDNLAILQRISKQGLESRFGLELDQAPLLVTTHPVTRELERTEQQVQELLAALEAAGLPVVFTSPNTDPHGRAIRQRIEEALPRHPDWRLVPSLGTEAYFSLMEFAAAMVGNSSSGLLEAPSFGLPAVNVGNRQKGRVRGANVIDVGDRRQEILEGIRKALTPEFRKQARAAENPYGNGNASKIIVERLQQIQWGPGLTVKRFVDRQFLETGEGLLRAR